MNLLVPGVAANDSSKIPAGTNYSQRFAKAILAMSALLCFGLILCFWVRPNAGAAITVFPVWCWFFGGLLLTLMSWRRDLKRFVSGVLTIWWLFLLLFADEPRSISRSVLSLPNGNQTHSLRVVSLNCSAGDALAADEVMKWKPDLVLLQESPSRIDVERLAHKIFGGAGGFVWGVDGSVLARGQLTPRPLSPVLRNYFVQAHVRLPDGKELEVISVRLITPPFRMDLWQRECWNAYTQSRQLQQSQMNSLAAQLMEVSPQRAMVVGGDFNAPQGDAIFKILQPRLQDSFARAGRGWGNTIINEFPALRIDQIWASTDLTPQSVRAEKTQLSDHRAVVADFLWKAEEKERSRFPQRG